MKILALAAALAGLSVSPAWADPPPATAPPYRPGVSLQPVALYDKDGNPVVPIPAGLTRTRLTCTLPAYAAGGTIACTNEGGVQTTAACAANTACLVSPANANRRTAFLTVRTAGITCDVGYGATVAPGTAIGIDGPATAGGQGGSLAETPAHTGPYHAACPSAATLVFVQGQ